MQLPDNCIRGISDPNYVLKVEDQWVALRGLFNFKNNPQRNDDWDEGSINWMDDEKARNFTLNQTKDDGSLKFKTGIAILSRDELNNVKKKYGSSSFAYERAATPSNRYHGNLLLKNNIHHGLKDQIRAMLAMNVSEIVLRDNS